jgi:glycosyltransferase involved in cell wall biosynthesis
MSSISEPFGLTTLEAAAHDDALIITKTSGVSESLRNVFLYDFWDTDKLADELVNLAESPALMNTLKSRVASEFDAYSWDNAAAGFMSAYRKVMKMGRSYA